MMITETEIVARFSRLESHVLQRWIAAGWLKPQENGTGFLFDDADVARTHLLCDLSFDMELRDEELAIVLSLVDRLNSTRTMLRALTVAVQGQPEAVRDAILAEMRVLLGGEPPLP
jgi:chaperone modulatory protein CbpM